MKTLTTRNLTRSGIISLILTFFIFAPIAHAATSPGLGLAKPFAILSGSYANSVSGTTLNGDLGYTTGPSTAPTVSGTTHTADTTYNQAGIDQNTALTALSSQPCTFTFANGPIDLASDTTHDPSNVGVYTPGVYCIDGAASIGGGGTITLNGAGTYIFRMDGALTTSANSHVVLSNGASACNVWWTPTAGTTLGANSTFAGTDIDASGIAIGSTVTWTGRALAFGGTVSTATDTINVPTCIDDTGGGSSSGSGGGSGSGSSTPGLPNTGERPASLGWSGLALLIATGLASAYVIRREYKRPLNS